LDPGNVQARLGLGAAYLRQGLRKLAVREFESLLGHATPSGDTVRLATTYIENLKSAGGMVPEWRLERFEMTTYIRYRTIADECLERGVNGKTILDVGGGNGGLCLFLPDSPYVLADLGVNGITATPLPFLDRSFDFVVSIDTLEHIAPSHRELFVSQLLRVSREFVILLGPFMPEDEGEAFDSCLLRVCPNPWTREHLQNGLPSLHWLQDFLSKSRVRFTVKPFSSLTLYLPLLVSQMLLTERSDYHLLETLADFFNTHYFGVDQVGTPVGYLIAMEI
jgi:SAM-dependent methyltransferase